MKKSVLACLAFSACVWAQGPAQTAAKGGYSIFDGTMVDMSSPAIEQAAKDHAVILWPMGVIEEHGPALPLGTDIYQSYMRMKRVAELLKADGINALIAPPMYWGMNEATNGFGGSFSVRPSTLHALIEDAFYSLRKDGFENVYITTGHGDFIHNKTIVDSVADARFTTGIRGYVVINGGMRDRLGMTGKEPQILMQDAAPPPANTSANRPPAAAAARPQYIDGHSGGGESGSMWYLFPNLVNTDVLKTLKPTNYGPEDLAEWRKGWSDARAKTPLGYFGDPASANRDRAQQAFERDTAQIAAAIKAQLQAKK
jgi:creatinine amidohydrolase